MSQFIEHASCPECGSSDGLAIYDDNEHCFVCEYHKVTGAKAITKETKPTKLTMLPSSGIPSRKLFDETVAKYKVGVNDELHTYPYYDPETKEHVANKVRKVETKEFYWEGDYQQAGLFGMHLFPPGGRAITITEGELDALSAFQMTGAKYPTVSVKSSSSAKKDCSTHFKYLDSFEKIVIAFDNDEPGQKAAKSVAQLFAPGKVHILEFQKHKDASDYLVSGDSKFYIDEWHRAPAYTPEGLRLGKDMWTDVRDHKTPKSVPYPWNGLNYFTYGLRAPEVVMITAETGIGKTSVVKEIEHALLMNPELIEESAGVGVLHLEEPNYDTIIGLMSINANKPFHLPDVERTEEELKKHYDAVINHSRLVVYDHFGSNDVDTILSKIRHMAALGCKYIVLDHFSIIVSDHSGDERKELDEISTKLKMLCMALNICVIGVIHQNRAGQIRGSAGVEQIANIVMKLYRDKTDPDPWRRNVTKIIVEKNRFCGRTGPACYLWYNDETGRLEELKKEQVEVYEKGMSIAGNEFDFYGKAA